MAYRLAIATPRFWPLVDDQPRHLLGLANEFAAVGCVVTVVTPQWVRTWPRQMQAGNIAIRRLPGAPSGGWSTLRWMYSLARWLRDEPPEMLLVAGLRQEAYVALGAVERSQMPVMLLAGEGDLTWQQHAPFGGRIAARCRRARTIVAPTQQLAEELIEAEYARHSLTIIPRAVALPPPRCAERQDEARLSVAGANHDLVTAPQAPVALAVGRFDAQYRFGDLVRAWRIVTARRGDARLWIIGDGPERERLYQQIGDLDQRFRVLIPGTFDCLEDLLQAADVFLVPAPHAVPPLAMLKAQATGLPVIAADAPAVREHVVPEQTGLVFSAGDIQGLADAVTRLVGTPAAALALGAAARDRMRAQPRPAEEAAQYLDLLRRPQA